MFGGQVNKPFIVAAKLIKIAAGGGQIQSPIVKVKANNFYHNINRILKTWHHRFLAILKNCHHRFLVILKNWHHRFLVILKIWHHRFFLAILKILHHRFLAILQIWHHRFDPFAFFYKFISNFKTDQ